jgi:hypothetical protein
MTSEPLMKETGMPLMNMMVALAIIGAAMWGVNTNVPMSRPIKTSLNVVVLLLLGVWLLIEFGHMGGIENQQLE